MRNLSRPRLTPEGNYDPVELVAFLRQCRNNSVPNYEIASFLRVSDHRISHALGEGWVYLKRRADQYARAYGAAA